MISNKVKTTVQTNTLTNSRSNFTVPQRRILYAIVETLSPYLRQELNLAKGKEVGYAPAFDDLARVVYKASDLCRPEDFKELRKALEQLEDKKVFIETEDFELFTRLILQHKFKPRSEFVELTINTEMYGILLNMNEKYTLYQTKVALSFTSIYAMKMYEILAMWREKGFFHITVKELRRLTDTQDKYTVMTTLKRAVLDVAKEQLDKSDITDLRFTYKEKKMGREIVGFDIKIIKTNQSHEQEKFLKENAPSLRWDFSKPLLNNFESYGILLKGQNAELIKQCKNRFGERWIAEKLDHFAKIGETKNNLAAYVISCFKNELDPNLSKKEPLNIPTIPQPIGSIIAQEKEVWEMSDAEKREYIAQKRAVDNEPLL